MEIKNDMIKNDISTVNGLTHSTCYLLKLA